MKKLVVLCLLYLLTGVAQAAEKIKLVVVKDFHSRAIVNYQVCMLNLNALGCDPPVRLELGSGYRHNFTIKVDNFAFYVKVAGLVEIDESGVRTERQFDESECRGYVKDIIILHGKNHEKPAFCVSTAG